MRVFLTTVAGSATRFSESIGKPTVKCIYNREDPAKTLLNHMLTQAKDYDLFVVVGGFLINELEDYINTNLPSEFSEKVWSLDRRIYHPHYMAEAAFAAERDGEKKTTRPDADAAYQGLL